jgi:hypothetical protein
LAEGKHSSNHFSISCDVSQFSLFTICMMQSLVLTIMDHGVPVYSLHYGSERMVRACCSVTVE